jgi:hypothetical protein
MKKTTLIATALFVSLSVPLAGTPAHAAGGDSVRRSGTCSDGSHWKLKATPDNGRLEVEAEVDSNVNGQTWRWKLRHDGTLAASGRSTTKAPSGSFSVSRRVDDHAGQDHLTFRAVQPGTGETCVGHLSV